MSLALRLAHFLAVACAGLGLSSRVQSLTPQNSLVPACACAARAARAADAGLLKAINMIIMKVIENSNK